MNHDIEKALDNLEKRAQDIQHYMNIMSKPCTYSAYMQRKQYEKSRKEKQ